MSANLEDGLLKVPKELLSKGQPVSIDIGGSVIKVIYRAADDDRSKSSDDDLFGSLHVVSFQRRDLQDGLEYIKRRTDVRGVDNENGAPPTLYATGFGSTQFGKLIGHTLNVRLLNVPEFDCLAKAFVYLVDRLPRHHLLEPFDVDACTEPIEFVRNQLAGIAALRSNGQSKAFGIDVSPVTNSRMEMPIGQSRVDAVQPPVDTVLSESESDVYPCLLVICGSAVQMFKVEADRSFRLVDALFQGGRSFCGIGALLTGCTTYKELVELAATGDHANVDQYSMQDVDTNSLSDDDDNSYKLRYEANAGWTFCFGKAASDTRGDFKREDLARAWLRYFANDLARSVNSTSVIHDVKRVFFGGGLCASSITRRVITAEMARRNMVAPGMSQRFKPVTFDFIRSGQYLGAIGCLVHGLQQLQDLSVE